MRGIIIVSRFWTNFFSGRRAAAVTIFPFIFLLDRICLQDRILLNHERIHMVQALELLVVPFYLWYVIEFLVRYFYYGNFRKAYLSISFEREAYTNETNMGYVKNRKIWSFVWYLWNDTNRNKEGAL
ncbi:hypothetical protein [Sphingobacterium suaedae]|uniref:DUF4157 domain-containing protein n=1 Tax=Sphingobacterium suaedae TaxID=1686402 RepID=A0ABW5KGH1_9SPHI